MDRRIAFVFASIALLSTLFAMSTVTPVAEWRPVQLSVPEGQTIHRVLLSGRDRFAAVFMSSKEKPRDLRPRIDIVSTRDGRRLQSFNALYPRLVTFAPSEWYLAIVGGTNVTVHDITTGLTVIDTAIAMPNRVSSIGAIGFNADESGICAVGEFGKELPEPNSWRFATDGSVEQSGLPQAWYGRHLSPDGKRVGHGGWPGPIPRVSELGENKSCCRFLPAWPEASPIASGFTPDSQAYYSVHDDGAMYVWEFGDSSDGPTATLAATAIIPDIETARGFDMMHTKLALVYIDATDKLRTLRLKRVR